MKKTLVFLLIIVAGAGAAVVEAQQAKKIPWIGILADVPAPHHNALQQGLGDLGYIEGENVVIERRYAKGNRERFPELAAELINLKVDVIAVSYTHLTLPTIYSV